MLIPQLEGKSLLFGTTASCGLGFMLFGEYSDMEMEMLILSMNADSPVGYDQGVFGGLLANPNFLHTFNDPDTTIQGQIVSTYTVSRTKVTTHSLGAGSEAVSLPHRLGGQCGL